MKYLLLGLLMIGCSGPKERKCVEMPEIWCVNKCILSHEYASKSEIDNTEVVKVCKDIAKIACNAQDDGILFWDRNYRCMENR